MSNEFVQALKQEIASLRKELETDPRFRKLERLVNALEAYIDEDEEQVSEAPQTPSSLSPANTSPATMQEKKSTGRVRSNQTQQILDIATSIIQGRSGPTSTSELLKEIQKHGISVHGQRPLNNLSAILSYSGQFQSNGRAGWTLKDENLSDQNAETASETHLQNGSPAASNEHRLASGGTTSRSVEPVPGGGT